jgi:pyridoxal biosynthesis lyase PdxS
LSSSVLTQLGF